LLSDGNAQSCQDNYRQGDDAVMFLVSRGDDNHGDGIDAVREYYFQGRDTLWIRRQTLLKSHLQLI